MFDLNAPIIPNISAAGIKIGQSAAKILAAATPASINQIENGQQLCFENVNVWTKNGLVDQIGVYAEYQGTIKGIIGIGSTMSDVQAAFGKIIEDDEDNLIIVGIPGCYFETEEWKHGHNIENNLDSRLIEIFVFAHET